MWGKIIIPVYRLWLNGLYGLYGPRCPLSSKRPINLISLSLSVLSLACHLPHNTPNIPSRYNNEQTTKQTKAINNLIYIYISCKCDTNRAGHFTLDAYASKPVACLSSDGLEESERHRSQKIYRSSEENGSKWVLFRIAMYRSSDYNLIFCPAVSAELPGVLMFWNPTDAGHKVACRACVRIPVYSGCKHRAPLWFTENIRLPMWVLSIAISIIDLNVHRWSTTKLM